MVNINGIPEPFREFLGANHSEHKKADQKEQGISATRVERGGRADMQDLLFLATILLLCDD